MAAEQHVGTEENSEKGVKRKREQTVLDNFTKLTNDTEKIRVKAGVDLLKYLWENKSSEKADHELKYALGRLIRGLGSSNVNAKVGFFSTLVALINEENVPVKEVVEHVSKELHKSGSNTKSENADICSGQILVAGAVLHSTLFENAKDSEKVEVLQLLLNAGKERIYLNLAAYTFLVELFKKVNNKKFETLIFPLIKTELSKPWEQQDLDNLYLLLEIQKCYPDSLHSNFLKNNLGTSEIFCDASFYHICDIITTIPRIGSLKHPVFQNIIDLVVNSNSIEKFFETLDKTLIRPNRSKYFAITTILMGVLQNLEDPNMVPELLTKLYIRQMLSMYKNSFGKQKDKEFEEITQKLFEVLVATLKKVGVKSKTQMKVLIKLLFFPGTFVFEKITKSKVIQNITATLNCEGVKKLGAVYRQVILGTNDKKINEGVYEKWWNTDRVYASHLLVKLVNHPAMKDSDWKSEQLILLAKLGLIKNHEFGNIGHELADSLKDTFYSSLDLKLIKLQELRVILSKVFKEFENFLENDSLGEVLRNPISDEDLEVWNKTVTLAAKLESKNKKTYLVFHVLFLHLGLHIFNNPKLASSSLKELFSCYEKSKTKNQDSDDPLWIEVVIDLFLNLLSHNSHVIRRIISYVFPHLCEHMNGTAIHQILSVLDPKNETNPLSQDSESESEEEDDKSDSEVEEEEESEEEEEENVNEQLRMALGQVLRAGESDNESVDLDDLDEEEGEKLDQALAQAFKQFKPNLGKNKKQKKDEEALTHFRNRVLDLVEIYVCSNPSMIHSLEIMLPLLQLLEFCIKDDHQGPLKHRVTSCLKKLTSLKKFSNVDDVSEEVLVDLLKSLLEKGTKNFIIIQEMSDMISNCCIFIISCSQNLEIKSKKISGVLKESLEAFFTRRDCVTPFCLFRGVLQMNWNGITALVPPLHNFVLANGVRPFRRSQAIELLKIFYHNQRFLSTHSDKTKKLGIETVNFLRNCLNFFKEFSENPDGKKVREKFSSSLFELLTSIKSSILGQKFDDWEAIGNAARDYRSHFTFVKETKKAFNKLCRTLNVSNIVEMKTETVKLNSVGEESEKIEKMENGEAGEKKRKKKKTKEKMQLKKKSKELRLQSLSEGMSSKRKFELEEEQDEDDREEETNKKLKVS